MVNQISLGTKDEQIFCLFCRDILVRAKEQRQEYHVSCENAIAQYKAEQAADQDQTQDQLDANGPNSGHDKSGHGDAEGDPQIQRPDNDTNADDQVPPQEKPATESDVDQDEKNA